MNDNDYSKFIHSDQAQTIAELLGVNPSEYLAVGIELLNLSSRSYNCLKRATINSLADILGTRISDFIKFKNLGSKSFNEILGAVDRYLKDSPHLSVFVDENNIDDIEPCDKHAEVTYLLDALARYVCSLEKGTDEYETVIRLMLSVIPDSMAEKQRLEKYFQNGFDNPNDFIIDSAIPEEIKPLSILPFIASFQAMGYHFPDNLVASPSDSVSDFILGLSREEFAQIKVFIKWLSFDLKHAIERLYNNSLLSERELDIIKKRINGNTLECICKDFSVTRERIRQQESKGLRILSRILQANNFVPWVFALLGGPNYLIKHDFEHYLSVDQIELLWWILTNSDENFYCSFLTPEKLVLSSDWFDAISSEIDDLPDLVDHEEMDRILLDLSDRKGFDIKTLLETVCEKYIAYPVLYSRKRLSLVEMAEYVFRTKFVDGLHITSDDEFSVFAKNIRECFNFTENLSHQYITSIIASEGILCEKGMYIHPANLHIDYSVVQEIIDYVGCQSDRKSLSYFEVFQGMKDVLCRAGIENEHILHGALKEHGCPFVLSKDYINKNSDASFDDDFISYVKLRYPISVTSLSRHFSISDLQCRQVIGRCSQLTTKGPMVFYIG